MERFYWLVMLLSFAFVTVGVCQDDEARSQSGLPTFIGNRPGPNSLPGTDAKLSGSFLVQGLDENTKPPNFSVAVLANGTLVARQPVKNRGGFVFNNVPRTNVSLIVEVDGLEITNYQIGTLVSPPLGNRHDVILTWSQVGAAVFRRNEVISIRNSYLRSGENQNQFERAINLSKDKKPDAAIMIFKQLLETDPKDFVAWTELGNLYFSGGKHSDAKAAYYRALELKGDFSPALLNLGKLLIVQNEFDPAVEILTNALSAMPDSADVNHYLGEAYLQNKKGSKAVVYLNKAIELAPQGKAELHLRLASLYNAANLKDRAVAEYKQFLIKIPNYPQKAVIEKYIKENSPK